MKTIVSLLLFASVAVAGAEQEIKHRVEIRSLDMWSHKVASKQILSKSETPFAALWSDRFPREKKP